jgi:hypothetical protein
MDIDSSARRLNENERVNSSIRSLFISYSHADSPIVSLITAVQIKAEPDAAMLKTKA